MWYLQLVVLLSWQSTLQTTVSTSSMQSEYKALYAGMQEIVWFRGVLSPLQSADDLVVDPVYHKRSKHIEVRYHWVREHVDLIGENLGQLDASTFKPEIRLPISSRRR